MTTSNTTKRKKFLVLIEDDFEIMGNGLGNVSHLQYLPSLALMNIAQKYGIKVTFMVDVAHQLALLKHIDQTEIRIQKNLWDETVILMKERGFDIQLHIHPQWLNASFNNGHFFVDNNWNLGCYSLYDQELLISKSIDYLHSLLTPQFSNYQVCAFKAGSWCLQPSKNLLKTLSNSGIKIIVGLRHNLRIPSLHIDYTNLEEKFLPYHPKLNDINKLARKNTDLTVIPLQPYSPNLFILSRLLLNKFFNKLLYKSDSNYLQPNYSIDYSKKASPLKGMNSYKFSLYPYSTHLKIGSQPFFYLKASFDHAIRRLRKLPAERIPIIIESHTKLYHNYYKEIDRFIAYITSNYTSEVEFGDFSSFANEILENNNIVRSSSED